MKEIIETMGHKVIKISEFHLAENFVDDKEIYEFLLKNYIQINVNGRKGNFHHFRFYIDEEKFIEIKYDEIDKNKKKLFEDVTKLLLKYIYVIRKEPIGEYGIIKSIFEITGENLKVEVDNFWSDFKYDFIKDKKGYAFKIKLYDKFTYTIYISKTDMQYFNFKINTPLYIKRIKIDENDNDKDGFVFDRDTQLQNKTKIETNLQIPNSNLEYGIITNFEFKKNDFGFFNYWVSFRYNNGDCHIWITKNQFELCNFKIGDKVYVIQGRPLKFNKEKQFKSLNLLLNENEYLKVKKKVGVFQRVSAQFFDNEENKEMVLIEVKSRTEFYDIKMSLEFYKTKNYKIGDLIMFVDK